MASRKAPAYARMCRRNLHTIPAGVKFCEGCKRETKRIRAAGRGDDRPEPAGGVAAYLRATHLPLLDILAGARCTPELAYLFDVGAPKSEKSAEGARHRAAQAVCADCPVAELCRNDAYASRQMGVYGGVVMDQAFWSLHGRGLVQGVQYVQDSVSC